VRVGEPRKKARRKKDAPRAGKNRESENMDAKITKKRLGLMLSYDWFKIALAAVALIVAWVLIFTSTATRLTTAQEFTVLNYTGTTAGSGFTNLKNKTDWFSYDIQKVIATDASAAGNDAVTIMQTRFATHDGDAVIVADTTEGMKGVIEYEDAQGQKQTVTPTHLQAYLMRYVDYTAKLDGEDGYFARMESYLAQYYALPFAENAQPDKQKIETDFRARIKKLNDKRYKNETQIKAGVQDEIQRIEMIYQSLFTFYAYLDAGYIALEETTYYQMDKTGKTEAVTGVYSINLAKNVNRAELRQLAYYSLSEQDNAPSSENLNIVLLNVAEEKYSYGNYESLIFINKIVETYIAPYVNA
jgi:hypothetical protein